MPDITAVFLTNEHLDHFHLPSIKRLKRSTKIYIGSLMPYCAREAIERMGFQVVSLNDKEPIIIGDINVIMYKGGNKDPFWEKRVYQLYCRDQNHLDMGGIYIQSDTLLSDSFSSHVNNNIVPSPDVFICTNNAQIGPSGVLGAFDNLLPIPARSETDGLTGLKILEEVLVRYTGDLTPPNYLVFNGCGYIQDKAPFGPFLFSDHPRLAELANQLSLDTKVCGLLPGEELDIKSGSISSAHWVVLDCERFNYYKNKITTDRNHFNGFLQKPLFEPFLNEFQIDQAIKSIESELDFMGKAIICSSLGSQLISANEYIDGAAGSKRFLFNFRTIDNVAFQYVLDLKEGRFVSVEREPIETLIRQIPYGVDVFLEDFYALLNGELQIWELATANMRQWHLGDKLDSPVAFLYRYFSEQVRQDLAEKVYVNLYAQ